MPTFLVTPKDGQTVFTLPSAPHHPLSVVLSVNDVSYVSGYNFKVEGNKVTWIVLPTEFALDSIDEVKITW